MLPKNNRLSRSDFDTVYKQGRRIRGKSFGLIVLPTENKNDPSKIGIAITKKVAKKAVDRNQLKRQIRSILVENILPTLPPGKKIILTAFPAPKTGEYQETRDELLSLLDKLKS